MRAYPRDRPQSSGSHTRSNQEKKFLLDLTLGVLSILGKRKSLPITLQQTGSLDTGRQGHSQGESGHDLAGLRQGPGGGPVSREANPVWLLARAYAFIATGLGIFLETGATKVHELSRTIHRHLE